MDWAALIGYVVGSTGVLGVVVKYLLDRQKQDDSQALAEEVQATKTLQSEVSRLIGRIDKLERSHETCMEQHVEEARKSGLLEGRVTEQSLVIQQQAAQIAAQSATIAELKTQLATYVKTQS